MNKKVFDLNDLGAKVAQLKKEGKKIVQCHGCFDLLHPGHVMHFKAAKEFGDVLVVSITEDIHVNKGPDRPIFTETIRAENIAALEYVDFVAINRSPKATPAIEVIKPNFYVKGQDYKDPDEDFTGGIVEEKNAVEKEGGELVFTEEIQFSSSRLINTYIDVRDDHVEEYFKKIKRNIDYKRITDLFDEVSDYRVLVIGDVILDEYQFVSPLGKSSKTPNITAKRLDHELYAGGSLAVANHISGFVSHVTLLSTYGINYGTNYLDFIKSHLKKNVEFSGVYLPNRPTVLKRRLVDGVFKHKLFEVIEIDDSEYSSEEKAKVLDTIHELKNNFDLIVVADFGHGLIDDDVVDALEESNIYLAVNAQTNSANKGFNLLTKYGKCDYFSIDKDEARLAVHDRYADITHVHKELMELTNAKLGSITLGVHGSAVMSSGGEASTSPALSKEVVDTIGAGDAYLSVTSLLAKHGATTEEIAFVGNAVGAMAVKILGNKSFIEKTALLKYIKTLLS